MSLGLRAVAAATFAVVLLAGPVSSPVSATTFCVPDFTAACPDNGTNVPKADLQTAVNTSASDGNPDRVLVGPIAETLVEHARKSKCDLIFIGTHARTEMGKALLGSVATKVMHISDIPVLLVK